MPEVLQPPEEPRDLVGGAIGVSIGGSAGALPVANAEFRRHGAFSEDGATRTRSIATVDFVKPSLS